MIFADIENKVIPSNLPKDITLAESISLQRDEDSGAVIVTLAVLQTYDLATGETHPTLGPVFNPGDLLPIDLPS